MNRIFRRALVFVIVVVLCGAFVSCSEPSKKDTPKHGSGGHHH
ncbi:MAG TPA: hypothetical protein ACFYD0_14875 [Candidatus Wunengus sp. YC65]